MIRVTYTLDEATVAAVKRSAERLAQPQSRIVRDAVREYADRIGRLTEAERRHQLAVFDHVVPAIPKRPLEAVEEEIRAIRSARRRGGRRRGR
jgi:hypothetical protein